MPASVFTEFCEVKACRGQINNEHEIMKFRVISRRRQFSKFAFRFLCVTLNGCFLFENWNENYRKNKQPTVIAIIIFIFSLDDLLSVQNYGKRQTASKKTSSSHELTEQVTEITFAVHPFNSPAIKSKQFGKYNTYRTFEYNYVLISQNRLHNYEKRKIHFLFNPHLLRTIWLLLFSFLGSIYMNTFEA